MFEGHSIETLTALLRRTGPFVRHATAPSIGKLDSDGRVRPWFEESFPGVWAHSGFYVQIGQDLFPDPARWVIDLGPQTAEMPTAAEEDGGTG